MTPTQSIRKQNSDIIKMQNQASKSGSRISVAQALARIKKANESK